MEKITLEIEDKKDLALLLALAERLGLKAFSTKHPIILKKLVNKNQLSKFYDIIEAGVDVTGFGNPIEWQKQVRTDRNLNL